MKNVSKNKFLTCFRPGVDVDAMLESGAVVDIDRHDNKISATKSALSDQKFAKSTHNWVVPHPPKRTLSKVIKAVLFEIMLTTRARQKNGYGQTCFGSKGGYSAYTECEKHASLDTKIKEIKGPELSLMISSSNSTISESKKLSKCESTKDQLEKQKKFQCLVINLFVISLAVTVLWGKTNVIVLTSILLCLFSLRTATCRWPKEVSKLRKTQFTAYKNGHDCNEWSSKQLLQGPKSFY